MMLSVSNTYAATELGDSQICEKDSYWKGLHGQYGLPAVEILEYTEDDNNMSFTIRYEDNGEIETLMLRGNDDMVDVFTNNVFAQELFPCFSSFTANLIVLSTVENPTRYQRFILKRGVAETKAFAKLFPDSPDVIGKIVAKIECAFFAIFGQCKLFK